MSANIKIDEPVKHPPEMFTQVEKKIVFFQDVIQKIVLNVQKNKTLEILGVSEVNACINTLCELSKQIHDLSKNINTLQTEFIINTLQTINNDISTLLKMYGTNSLDDLLSICFGNNNSFTKTENERMKFNLLKKYFHPTSYKLVKKEEHDNSVSAAASTKSKKSFLDDINEHTANLECYDISLSAKPFHMKIYGIKVYIRNESLNKSIIVYGVVDEIIVDFLNDDYVALKKKDIMDNLPKTDEFNTNGTFDKFMSTLILKDYLTSANVDIYGKFVGYVNQFTSIKQKHTSQVVKDFISSDLYLKRLLLIQLLIQSHNYENQYLAYLLYDLLSNDSNGSVDTHEQVVLFDSFPWQIKKYFRDAMKNTIQYTNELSNFDTNKIPLEQQICLLKVDDSVKEKAMVKLKEVKAKTEDSGSKARQYLDGLLKIPFNIYKKEPVLNVMNKIRHSFQDLYTMHHSQSPHFSSIPNKPSYTSIEIVKYIKDIKNKISQPANQLSMIKIKGELLNSDKPKMIQTIIRFNEIIDQHKLTNIPPLKHSNKGKTDLKKQINDFIDANLTMYAVLIDISKLCSSYTTNIVDPISTKVNDIETDFQVISSYMDNVKLALDGATHGHTNAKKQIERIVGQWINGTQDGYCFGFEGPPGVGKTTMAKRGLSDCLKDEFGQSRPFSMIQMGGDSNGSSLHGHNYTYVGSTWGSIVQILIDKKCMNPIIFIDELDKISKTEHGKEIVGILTHLLDPSQNDCFQDKYFSGIDLDLSKALFVLSYNDVDAIDRILLDRIHRIKFSNLSIDDKLIIAKTHILPEVYLKMGLIDMIIFTDDVLKFVIEEYTCEAGVRKLKETLFEIVGEINLDVLKNINTFTGDLPICVTIDDIKTKYFKDKHEVKHKKIHDVSIAGIINGLWANALGQGGVIPIQVKWFPCKKFMDLKLTGLQGDVMKESMNVAQTLAWSLTEPDVQQKLNEQYNTDLIKYGIHIHCPEGSVPKDGPSAGGAITTAIYSLLNDKKIKYNMAMTGEISLNGEITEIGGLDLKFLGGIKAGVTEFIYPDENKKDYDKFIDKYKGTDLVKDIRFNSVNNIKKVFEIIFE